MIVDVEELMQMQEFVGAGEKALKRKLEGLENLIRSYTNNNFQNRKVRFSAGSEGNTLFGNCPFLKCGDTVQITQSNVNDGLYVVTEVDETQTSVDKELFNVPTNLVTKVEYPPDIQQGIIDLMRWEVENRQKVGIKSETISRHSVTYYDLDANNQVMGYPVSLLGFLKPYMKARF